MTVTHGYEVSDTQLKNAIAVLSLLQQLPTDLQRTFIEMLRGAATVNELYQSAAMQKTEVYAAAK